MTLRIGIKAKPEVPGGDSLASLHSLVRPLFTMRLFVNRRQKHVTSEPMGAASNRGAGVCCGGRGLVVLL